MSSICIFSLFNSCCFVNKNLRQLKIVLLLKNYINILKSEINFNIKFGNFWVNHRIYIHLRIKRILYIPSELYLKTTMLWNNPDIWAHLNQFDSFGSLCRFGFGFETIWTDLDLIGPNGPTKLTFGNTVGDTFEPV